MAHTGPEMSHRNQQRAHSKEETFTNNTDRLEEEFHGLIESLQACERQDKDPLPRQKIDIRDHFQEAH
jgi:hypothetical protein